MAARALRDKINASTGQRHTRAGVKPKEFECRSRIAERAKLAVRYSRLVLGGDPWNVSGLHHDGRAVSRLGIFESPARPMLPNCFVTILIMLAAAIVEPGIDTLLEGAFLTKCVVVLLVFG